MSPSSAVRACFHCGLKESVDLKLVRCARCYNENSIDTLYCSTACQKFDWKEKHKQWHNESTERDVALEGCFASLGSNIDSEHAASVNKMNDPTITKYQKLTAEGMSLIFEKNDKLDA